MYEIDSRSDSLNDIHMKGVQRRCAKDQILPTVEHRNTFVATIVL